MAYSGTEEEMVKHVLSSHGMPRLHRFIGDVYDFDVGEAPDILSQDQENDPSIGQLKYFRFIYITVLLCYLSS